jgi:hypothetical protein
MNRQILDPSSAPAAVEGGMPGTVARRSMTASVSAGIAAANSHLPKLFEPALHFSPEDSRHTLIEMAGRDLDATLQLLAERAQYITAATGAAIALRRGEHPDMLCRASAGSNAPELGAILSMEYGLSGESVRTRQILRCDDAERDPRVNHEACHRLGIASVVVMPILSDGQVFGVFELLSGRPRAFDERDLSALQRLSEMVELAVKYAVAAHAMPPVQEAAVEPGSLVFFDADDLEELDLSDDSGAGDSITSEAEKQTVSLELKAQEAKSSESSLQELRAKEAKSESDKEVPAPTPPFKKPLFWTAATPAQETTRPAETTLPVSVPPVLRNLQKCEACGFPVSQGRTFCVECEEKQWRGQLPRSQATTAATAQPAPKLESRINMPAAASDVTAASSAASVPEISKSMPAIPTAASAETQTHLQVGLTPDAPTSVVASYDSTPFLSSAIDSQSWFAANKYVLGTLLIVAIVISAIALLR